MAWLRWLVLGAPLAYKIYKEATLPKPQGIQIGHLLGSFSGGREIGIPPEERLKHTHILGATGNGKTTLMKNMIIQDMEEDNGLCVIDPKGGLIEDVLLHIPPWRVPDVILFDATDRDHPIGFNAMEWVPPEERSRTASEVLSVFKKLYASSSWGPRLEYILRYCILLLLEVPGSTLFDIHHILLNDAYLGELLKHVSDPTVLSFWQEEYLTLSSGARMQAIMPILNKVGPWLSYPETRNIVAQPYSSFDLRSLMDERKILLVKIPQGILGEDASAYLGAMLVSKIQLAAMTRVNLLPEDQVPFFLYVDEFQNFVTGAFEKTLTEARSFGLGLIVVNQFPQQLPPNLRAALEHNVAVQITCYRDGEGYHAEYKMMQDIRQPTLNLRPLWPPQGGSDNVRRFVQERSRLRYTRPRQEVEDLLLKQLRRRKTQFRRGDGGKDNGDNFISFREPPP